jgi:hypothetical protein
LWSFTVIVDNPRSITISPGNKLIGKENKMMEMISDNPINTSQGEIVFFMWVISGTNLVYLY